MLCLNISTNTDLRCVNTRALHSDIAKTVAKIMSKSENHVMTVFTESEIRFDGSDDHAAYGEFICVEGLNPMVNNMLVAAIAGILQRRMCVPKKRFLLKFSAPEGTYLGYNGSTV